MPEDLRQLGTPIETKDGAQSKADAAEDSAINYTDSEVDSHENSTSGVHGVGTSDVESESGAQAKADAAESSANDYTDSEVSSHENSTSDVHGVGASNVESESGAQSKVDSHESSTSGVHGVGDGDVASTADVAEKADDPHGNDAHSETFAVDGDEQPPENHDHAGDDLSPNSVVSGLFGLPSGWTLTENDDSEAVFEDSGGNVVLRRDATNGEWVTDSIDAETATVTDSFTDPGGNTYTGRIGADTRRSVNQLFVQSARQDFELGLTVLDFSDGQFEIFANDDNIEESPGIDINFGSPLDDAGIAELADGETEGYSQHVEEDFGFLPSSAWVTDDVPGLPDGATVEFEIEDENGNIVRIGRDEVDSDVNLSDDIETYGIETRAVLERDTDTDPTPVLDSYSVYLEGGVPDEYLDAEIESTEET